MADQLNLRSTTFTAGNSWLATYGTSLRNNDLYLGRCRWTSGDPVLEQADCEQGALYAHATDKLLYFFRIDGTATSDDATRKGLAAPMRAIWHYDDRTGAPETDGRSQKGDLYVVDDATNDRYLAVCTGTGTYGLGVRADYRTAATALSTTQNSDAVAWRSSRWVTSAAKYRQVRSILRNSASSATTTFLSIYYKPEEGTEFRAYDFGFAPGSSTKFFINGDGAGAVPGFGFTADPTGVSPGSISCVIGPDATDIDGTAVWFKHGDSTRHVRWRYFGVDDETTAVAAEVLAVTYQQAASGGETIKRSPSLVHRAAAWSGAASVEMAHYSQLVPTSSTSGYIEHGFDFGSGTYKFYGTGLLDIAGSSTGGILLSRYTAATGGAQLVDSSLATWRGAYWNGAASVDANATTKLVADSTGPLGHLSTSFDFGSGTLDLYSDGGVQFQMDPNGTSNYANTLTLYPTLSPTASLPSTDSPYFSAVARSDVGGSEANRYIFWNTKVDSVVTASDQWSFRLYSMGGGSPTEILGVRSTGEILPADGSSAVLELSAALGTHTGTTNTDKTGNSKLGTLKVKLSNGTTAHIQLYAD